MTAQRRVGLSGVALLVVVFVTTGAHAQQFVPTGRDTLRGLPGVEVVVEPLAPELAKDGLTEAAVRANVERALRSSSILVYSSQSENPSPAKPYLYVQLTGLFVERQGYALAVQVHLRQTLRSLVTSSNIVNAITWDQQTVLFMPAGTSMQSVHSEVQMLVDQFVQDWRRVH
jgi:hypothetical protein